MSQTKPLDLAKVAYAAYGDATGGLNYQGAPMPAWDDLGTPIQSAWVAAARAITQTAATVQASTVQTPSLGRIVLVAADPAKNNGSDVAPAAITRVWTGTSINVRVLLDGPDVEWRTSLTYAEDLADLDDNARLYRWTWPPRV
jgi:hypothetical protein